MFDKLIFNTSGEKTEMHSLLIQSSYACSINCSGCYLKTREDFDSQIMMDPVVFHALLERFCDRKAFPNCWTNEITISIDCLSPKIYQRETLIKYLNIKQYSKFNNGPRIHLTANSLKELNKYPNSAEIQSAKLLSLSNIYHDDLLALRLLRNNGVRIGWNYVVPTNIESGNPKDDIEDFVKIVDEIDQVYLILQKGNVSRTTQAVKSWSKRVGLLETLPESVTKKIILDQCMVNALDHKMNPKLVTGCSSNISIFHVWPNGSVTGCPYKQEKTRPADTVDGIIQNIEKARESWDFTNCIISKVTKETK